MFFVCQQYQVRITCSDQVTVTYLTTAGVITINDNCAIKTNQLTLHAHKYGYSRMDYKPEIVFPDFAPINHMINISVPIVSINETYENQTAQLIKIKQGIQEMKENAKLDTSVSFHDVHHYAAIYVIVCVGVVVLGVYACRKCRSQDNATITRRRRRRRPDNNKSQLCDCEHIGMSTLGARDNSGYQGESSASATVFPTMPLNQFSSVESDNRDMTHRGTSPIKRNVTFSPIVDNTLSFPPPVV